MRISVPLAPWREELSDLDDVEIVLWDEVAPQPPGNLDLVVRPLTVDPRPLAEYDPTRVRAVQGYTIGYDGVADHLPPGILYCNAVGVHEATTAEHACALLTACMRDLPRAVTQQNNRQWRRYAPVGLLDRRVIILGVGGIGQHVYQRLVPAGVDIVRVASSARDDEFGHVHGTVELPRLLPEVDAVIVAVPLTNATEHLIDEQFLESLSDGAVVVNVSRGKVADTDAVVAQAGRVVYATDVTEPEPLPTDHPLWGTPNVLLTPHVAGMSRSMDTRLLRLVRAQVGRLATGQPPLHVVLGQHAARTGAADGNG